MMGGNEEGVAFSPLSAPLQREEEEGDKDAHANSRPSLEYDSRDHNDAGESSACYCSGEQLSLSVGERISRSEGERLSRSEGKQLSRSEGERLSRSEGERLSRSEGEQLSRSEGEQLSRSEGDPGRSGSGSGAALDKAPRRYNGMGVGYTSCVSLASSSKSTWYLDLGVSSTVGGDSDGSLASSSRAGSEASITPNKYGFVGGAQYTLDGEEKVPVHVIRKRESKWLEMLKEWDTFMVHRYEKVRDRCRKGIPSAIRARAWQHLCGADRVMKSNLGVFEKLAASPTDCRIEEEIRKDLHRQFPFHELFLRQGGQGQEDLYLVLKVHSLVCGDGYCQAHAPVAAVLLMQMPAEEAFWCLRAICDKYVPGYYSHNLEAIQIDGRILFKLLKKVSPSVYKLLKKQKIDPVLYMTEWFLCLYVRSLPWASVLRVWDMFFCEGVKVLFRVGLVLLKFGLRPEVRAKCPSLYETLQSLRHIAPGIVAEDFLLTQLQRLDITEDDLQKEHMRQITKREQEKLQYEKQEKQQGKQR